MSLLENLDSLRCCDEAHEYDVLAAALLNEVDCSYCTAAGCQHRVSYENLSLIDVLRHFAVVFNRFVGFRISVKPHMSNLGIRDDFKNTVNHAQTCSQNRNNCHVFTLKDIHGCLADRCLDFNLLQREITAGFKSHQHSDFLYNLSEILR